MAQAQPETQESHDVVITIDVDADEPKCCCVCTEPLEWVAVGPCGHRDVCAGCATRIHFFAGDWRCCICRTPCPTVLVTKAGTAATGADRARRCAFVVAACGRCPHESQCALTAGPMPTM
ncbi:unnamed protein product [Urochloa humidicola]